MGIGNLTELTEADTTGVNAMLIGFCQELGIRNVLTTEVIDWARGAVREAVLAAQLMHFAQHEGTPPKHVDGRLLTIKDEDVRPTPRPSCASCTRASPTPTSASSPTPTGSTRSTPSTSSRAPTSTQIFDELGVDEHTHAFYLGKELMKASIARALRKNYRQESPLDWGYLTFDRAAPQARPADRALATRPPDPTEEASEEDPAPARHRRAPEPVRRDRRLRRRRRHRACRTPT